MLDSLYPTGLKRFWAPGHPRVGVIGNRITLTSKFCSHMNLKQRKYILDHKSQKFTTGSEFYSILVPLL